MGYFTEKIAIEPAGGELWRVLRAFSYVTDKVEEIGIPIGFTFDGASIPKIIWSVVGHPLEQEYLAAACIHDFLYTKKIFTRKRSDRIFYEAMRDLGVSYLKRTIMWLAVRMCGWKPWLNKAPKP